MERLKPIVAILYDFDKTLCTQDMQNYAFIPALGMEPGDFWREANAFVWRQHMDVVLDYMDTMIPLCRELEIPLTRSFLSRYGVYIVFFTRVRD